MPIVLVTDGPNVTRAFVRSLGLTRSRASLRFPLYRSISPGSGTRPEARPRGAGDTAITAYLAETESAAGVRSAVLGFLVGMCQNETESGTNKREPVVVCVVLDESRLCGPATSGGSCLLCVACKDSENGREYFPDIVVSHPFVEVTLAAERGGSASSGAGRVDRADAKEGSVTVPTLGITAEAELPSLFWAAAALLPSHCMQALVVPETISDRPEITETIIAYLSGIQSLSGSDAARDADSGHRSHGAARVPPDLDGNLLRARHRLTRAEIEIVQRLAGVLATNPHWARVEETTAADTPSPFRDVLVGIPPSKSRWEAKRAFRTIVARLESAISGISG